MPRAQGTRYNTLALAAHALQLDGVRLFGEDVLHDGRVIADGTRDEIRAHPLVGEIYLGA